MKVNEYQEHLQKQNVSADNIKKQILIIKDFLKFLSDWSFNDITAAGKH
jgi:site-specific recombinase XerD